MSVCILAGGKLITLAVSVFTLSWTHSVQKTEWQEDWQVTPAGLAIAEARVEGSGAGMEAGEGAVFDGFWWRYKPALPPLAKLVLARSGAAGSWRFCSPVGCTSFDGRGQADAPLEISPCGEAEP